MPLDPRRFLRYRRNEEISLLTAKGQFTIKLLEYSPFGIKIQTDSIVSLDQSVKVVYRGIANECRVKWVRGNNAGLEFKSPVRGSLRDYGVAGLLAGLKKAGLSGLLKITANKSKAKIYIKDGDPSADQTTLAVFTLRDGEFEFTEGMALPKEIPPKTDLAGLIFAGIKVMDDIEYLDSLTGGPDALYVRTPDSSHAFPSGVLDEHGAKILGMMNGKNSMASIRELSLMEELESLRSVYALLCLGFAEIFDLEEVQGIDEEFAKEVQLLSDRCEETDYYEILGVPRDTSVSEIRKAYYAKVKRYHPDIFYLAAGEEFKTRLSRIFSRLNLAYSVLSRDASRHVYNDKPDTRTSPGVMAGEMFETGLDHFSAGRYQEALQCLGRAVYLQGSTGKYHYHYALALRKLKRNKEAERAFLDAIRTEPGNDEYIAELGHLYLLLGMKIRARKTFEKALGISKENKKARDGMELLGEKEREEE